MDELQNRYKELEELEGSLKNLAEEIKDEYFKDAILELMYEAQIEKEEIKPDLDEITREYERNMRYVR